MFTLATGMLSINIARFVVSTNIVNMAPTFEGETWIGRIQNGIFIDEVLYYLHETFFSIAVSPEMEFL